MAMNLPNALTMGRIAAVPVIVALVLWGSDAARLSTPTCAGPCATDGPAPRCGSC